MSVFCCVAPQTSCRKKISIDHKLSKRLVWHYAESYICEEGLEGGGGSSFFSSYRLTVLQNRSYAERLCKYVFSSLVISVKD